MIEIIVEIKNVLDNFLPLALGIFGLLSVISGVNEVKPQKSQRKITVTTTKNRPSKSKNKVA